MSLKNNYFVSILKLLRPKQWYKNLLIFAGIFFSMNLFNFNYLSLTLQGFFVLCIVSSGNYIINDILDYKKDKLNPEKKNRPIASGKISRFWAFIIAFICYGIGFFFAYNLNLYFFLIVLGISILTFFYSIFFKHEVILDIVFISSNFVLRAISGVVLIDVSISLWFFLEIFFLSFYLVCAKRYVDVLTLKKNELNYKPVLKKYDINFLNSLLVIFLTALILVYGFYSFYTNILLFILYPILVYILIYYHMLVLKGDVRTKDPEKFIFTEMDFRLIISAVIFTIGVGLIYYIKMFF